MLPCGAQARMHPHAAQETESKLFVPRKSPCVSEEGGGVQAHTRTSTHTNAHPRSPWLRASRPFTEQDWTISPSAFACRAALGSFSHCGRPQQTKGITPALAGHGTRLKKRWISLFPPPGNVAALELFCMRGSSNRLMKWENPATVLSNGHLQVRVMRLSRICVVKNHLNWNPVWFPHSAQKVRLQSRFKALFH